MTEGALNAEQLLECARRNNTELLETLKSTLGDAGLAQCVNATREVVTNNSALHLAVAGGHWEVLDVLLDVEGIEIDPQNREGNTPLHAAVLYAADEPEHGAFIVENLVEVGSDPRIKNSHGLRPVQLVRGNAKVRALLEETEYALSAEQPEEVEVDDASDLD